MHRKKDLLSFLRAISGRADTLSLVAVRDTMKILLVLGETEAADAVREIYFENIHLPLKRSEITLRVRSFASRRYLDERTVYRRLQRAGRLYLNVLEARQSGEAA